MEEGGINFKEKRLLIAEDDEISAYVVLFQLKKHFKEIVRVRNGDEAIEYIKSNPEFEIILMDVNMPQKDGFEACMEIREFNKDVVIVMQTAYSLNDFKNKLSKHGCDDFIIKPIVVEDLLEKLQHHLQKRINA